MLILSLLGSAEFWQQAIAYSSYFDNFLQYLGLQRVFIQECKIAHFSQAGSNMNSQPEKEDDRLNYFDQFPSIHNK